MGSQPGALDPMTAAALGAGITLWATFVPCFYWIFLGAPFVEKMRGNAALSAALAAVSAAVVVASEAGRVVGGQGIQLHGGVGMTEEYQVGHYFKRLLVTEKLWGDVDFHLDRIAFTYR